jgi:hypothetical protein
VLNRLQFIQLDQVTQQTQDEHQYKLAEHVKTPILILHGNISFCTGVNCTTSVTEMHVFEHFQ